MTLTCSVTNLKSFIKKSCFNFFTKAEKCHFHNDLDEWKISFFLDGGRKKICDKFVSLKTRGF
jgi:hypothetical protein